MNVCNACGGVVGRDCWNPEECQQITEQMRHEEASPSPSLIGKVGHPDCATCHGSGVMQTTMDTLNPDEGGFMEPCDKCPGLPGARVRLASMARDIDLGLTPLCAWPAQLSNPTSATAKATAYDIGLVLAALTEATGEAGQ